MTLSGAAGLNATKTVTAFGAVNGYASYRGYSGAFGVDKFGEPLFFPDAGKREEAL